ncbi:ubiquinone biosynthesis protein COQ9, mitochondrial-like [Ostrea edulis]|uniref:ubiquinone biosynthesis protein COQ9, mitochondrial-like n=1 Tax=Ostrea edulis TaxID=37623 RepID=UPI0024AF626F|nr:ubiquinone biosynthesis protein COQ9, mitochondrial-like [Ostrea edulis]
MAAPCINRCGSIFRTIRRTALSRYSRQALRQMCTGDKDQTGSTFVDSESSGNSSGRNQFNTHGSNQQEGFSNEESQTTEEYSSQIEEEEVPEETEEEFQTKQAILKASLPFVHQYGWTKKAIVAGAETIGYPSVVHGMFPRGGAELVFYFYEECNAELTSKMEQKLEELKVKEE